MSITSPYPVIYAFGDSLSDGGDAYLLTNSFAASLLGLSPEPVSPPYYLASYGGVTGHLFSNGPVWVQDLATSLGITAPAPAAVGISAGDLTNLLVSEAGLSLGVAQTMVAGFELSQGLFGSNPFLTIADGARGGTDFAIGGSVTGVSNENSGAIVPLTDLTAQVNNFGADVSRPVANALYTVWSGSNDILNIVQDPNFASLYASGAAASDVSQSVANEIGAIRNLVAAGARNLLVLDVPDLGKVPEVTAAGTTIAADASILAAAYDAALRSALDTGNFSGARISFEDTYGLIEGAIANPSAYGLTNVTGSVYTGSFTVDNGTLASSDPAVQNTYLFFDQLHPTETGQRVIAGGALAALGIACFAAGTRIATPRGERAVEALREGELVLTVAGAIRPVRWVGQTRIDLERHPQAEAVAPVRIAAGAFGGGMPVRDLVLSPDHAVFVGAGERGVLVPVGLLVNGASIRRVPARGEVRYFHVELDSHDVLIADGLHCESYLDTGNRAVFANAAPDVGSAGAGVPCAPLVTGGARLAAIRAMLGATQEALAA